MSNRNELIESTLEALRESRGAAYREHAERLVTLFGADAPREVRVAAKELADDRRRHFWDDFGQRLDPFLYPGGLSAERARPVNTGSVIAYTSYMTTLIADIFSAAFTILRVLGGEKPLRADPRVKGVALLEDGLRVRLASSPVGATHATVTEVDGLYALELCFIHGAEVQQIARLDRLSAHDLRAAIAEKIGASLPAMLPAQSS